MTEYITATFECGKCGNKELPEFLNTAEKKLVGFFMRCKRCGKTREVYWVDKINQEFDI